MVVTQDKLEILNRLVGNVDMNMAQEMGEKLECFLHQKVAIFIPSSGQCPYAAEPDHIHHGYSFIYYFQPYADFYLEGKYIQLEMNDEKCLSVLSPKIVHHEGITDTFQSYIAIIIDKVLFEKIFMTYAETMPIFKGELYKPHPELLSLLRAFMLEMTQYPEHGMADALAEMICHMIVRSVISESKVKFPMYDRMEIDRAIGYMRSHINEKLNLEDLARYVNLSVGHFSKTFKKVTGESAIEFLNHLRLQKAKNMLLSGEKNMTVVAMTCGFSSPSYFSTCFLEYYKISPSQYIKKIGEV